MPGRRKKKRKARRCEKCHRTHRRGVALCSTCVYYESPEAWFHWKQATLRGGAKRRGLKCKLPKGFLHSLYEKQGGVCAISGEKMRIPTESSRHRPPDLVSIDRIDPERGYVVGNVRLTTLQANVARGRWSDERLLAFAKRVVRRLDVDS